MRCEECRALLEEYADGETRGREAARVEAHLGACAACARERQRLDAERAVFLSYECDAAPAEAFWEEVLSKIAAAPAARPAPSPAREATPASDVSRAARARARLVAALGVFAAPRLSPAVVAALLFVAVGATVAVMKYVTPREATDTRETARATAPESRGDAEDGPSAAPSSSTVGNEAGAGGGEKVEKGSASGGVRAHVAARPKGSEKSGAGGVGRSVRVKGGAVAESGEVSRGDAASLRGQAPERLVREAEQKYLAAIRLLSRDVSGRRARLDADTRARFEQTLAAVDRTIADTRRAAREHPRDPVAVQYMLTAYAKKVEVLREMARR